MKLFPNLAGGLRTFFGLLQILALVFGVVWLFVMLVGPRLQGRLAADPRLMVSAGEITWAPAMKPIALDSNSAKTGSLEAVALRGTLLADFMSKDSSLANALRWTLFPSMLLVVGFSWFLCGALRKLCSNMSRGVFFSEANFGYVRQAGLLMIAYSLLGAVVSLWAAHVMGAYLDAHVTAAAVAGVLPSAGHGALRFNLAAGAFPNIDGFITGCVVLVIAQAFRQGLALKTESELTV